MCRLPPSHHAVSSVRDRTDSETEQDPSGPSRQAHGLSEPLHSLERGRARDRPYEIPLLTRAFEWPSPERDEHLPRFAPRISPGVEPPLTPTTDPLSGPGAVRHLEESDRRLPWPGPRPDSESGRHRSAPLYGSDDWDRRVSFGKLPPPGTQPEGDSSRVVLPPVRDLLGELGMLSPERYERGPVLPQLRLPDEPHEEGERTRGRSGKQRRMEMGMGMGEEKEEKRPVARKIYVACDFCRGRKLRCDGGRPRCFNCETRSLECKYQEHPRRRGPGKRPKGPRKKGSGGGPDMAGPSGIL